MVAIDKHFEQDRVVGKGRRGWDSVAFPIETHEAYAGWDREVGNGTVLHGLFHKVEPDRCGHLATRFALPEGVVIVPAHPDAGHEFRRIAHKPGVVVIVGRTRLASRWTCEGSDDVPRAVFDHTLHHAGHEIRHFRAGGLPGVLITLAQHFAFAIDDLRNDDRFVIDPAIGKRPVGRSEFHQGDA